MAGPVELNAKAPDIALPDFKGRNVRLSDYQERDNALLVFNRGFF